MSDTYLLNAGRVERAQPFRARRVQRQCRLAQEDVGERPAAHADLAMDAPDRQLDALGVERLAPGEHMLIDAVDERSVEIEDEGRLRSRHRHAPGRSLYRTGCRLRR
jgi:hypothetical protein